MYSGNMVKNIAIITFIAYGFVTADNITKISLLKCQEFSKYVFNQEDSPLLLSNTKGIQTSQCDILDVPLIVGGEEVREKEFPHMAVIGYGAQSTDTLTWKCGGVLISEQYILTAAHCLSSRESGPAQKVKLGMVNLQSNENVQVIAISEGIVHPEYKPPLKYNDIGLFKLVEAVTFTPFVRPACLNPYQVIGSKTAIATGFGKLSYDSAKVSQLLMKVDLNIIPNDICNNNFNKTPTNKIRLSKGIDNSMICAGELLGGKDTCQGDSGGPLQIALDEPYCMYSIIGITSFGTFCGFPNSPGVYTRVSQYLSWIENKVWGNLTKVVKI